MVFLLTKIHKCTVMYRSLLHVDTCSLHEKHAEGSVLMFVIAMPNKL